jgi:hypothetical protein
MLLLLPSRDIAELDYTPSKVTQEHLQSFMSQGFMTAVELMTCHVPEDPTSPAPAEGYMVSFVAFTSKDLVCRRTDSPLAAAALSFGVA